VKDLKQDDDHEAYKRRIRALVDRLEKGEDFKEEFEQSFDEEQGEKEDVANTSFSHLRKRIFNRNPEIRTKAIKGLIEQHPDKSIHLVTDTLTRDNSLYVFANTWKDLESTKIEEYHQLLDSILTRFSKSAYNLKANDVKFLLDYSNPIVNGENDPSFEDFYMHRDFGGIESDYVYLDGSGGSEVELNPTTIHYRYLKNNIIDDDTAWISIYQGHITGLIIYSYPDQNDDFLPKSIRYLKKLKFLQITLVTKESGGHSAEVNLPEVIKDLNSLKWLSISDYNVENLSKYLRSLTNLRELKLHLTKQNLDSIAKENLPELVEELMKLRHLSLNLYGVNLDSIPPWVKEIARKYHSRQYIKEGVVANDAFVLGLLEILLGEKIQNYKITARRIRDMTELNMSEEDLSSVDEYFFKDPFYYKLTEKGKVSKIVIGEQSGEHDIRILPEEILILDALEELNVFCRGLRIVPDAVIKKFPHFRPVRDRTRKNGQIE
jgi:hypothetical protein